LLPVPQTQPRLFSNSLIGLLNPIAEIRNDRYLKQNIKDHFHILLRAQLEWNKDRRNGESKSTKWLDTEILELLENAQMRKLPEAEKLLDLYREHRVLLNKQQAEIYK